MGALSYQGQVVEVLTPSTIICHVDLWPKQGFGELVWELPALGLRAPFLSVNSFGSYLMTQRAMPFWGLQ
jgi:hypothetical protein